jgi:hypothetical protein
VISRIVVELTAFEASVSAGENDKAGALEAVDWAFPCNGANAGATKRATRAKQITRERTNSGVMCRSEVANDLISRDY